VKRFIVKRLGYAVLSLLLLSLTIFLLVRLTGDPSVLLVEPGASKEDLAAVRLQVGLDRPIWVQYGQFMSSLARGLMLADGKKGLMAGYWWLTVLPGLCIMFMVLSANLLGDWLRVKLDPQLRQL